jgi:hypothetical protein
MAAAIQPEPGDTGIHAGVATPAMGGAYSAEAEPGTVFLDGAAQGGHRSGVLPELVSPNGGQADFIAMEDIRHGGKAGQE